MNQGIGMYKLNGRGSKIQGLTDLIAAATRTGMTGGVNQCSTHAFAATQRGVAHCVMQPGGNQVGGRQQPVEHLFHPLRAPLQPARKFY